MSKTVVDSGALQLALNVLRRAGKEEVADALEKSGHKIEREPIGYMREADISRVKFTRSINVALTEGGHGPTITERQILGVSMFRVPIFLGSPCILSKTIGHYKVTVDENAITISDGHDILFAYDGDTPDSAPIGSFQRDAKHYASAIGNAAIKSGIYRKDLEGMTGPMLLMACDDMAECINSITAQLGLAAYTLHQVQTLLVNEVSGADASAKTWPLLRLKTVTDTVDSAIEKIDPRGDWKTSTIIDDNHPIAKGPNHER